MAVALVAQAHAAGNTCLARTLFQRSVLLLTLLFLAFTVPLALNGELLFDALGQNAVVAALTGDLLLVGLPSMYLHALAKVCSCRRDRSLRFKLD